MSGGGRAVAALGVALVAACGDAGRDTHLVVHTPLPDAVTGRAEALFEAAHPTVDVRVVTSDDPETLAALRSADEPVDVWWGASGLALAAAAGAGLLQPYEPAWSALPGPVGGADAEGRWHATLVSPFVIAFDRDRVGLSDAPTDWVDLFHYAWTEEIDLVDPVQDPDMRYFVAAMLMDALRNAEDLERGFEWHARLTRSVGEYVREPEEVIRRLRRGDALLTILPRHVVEAARHDGAPSLHYRPPESRTPVLVRGVAIPAAAAEPELARAFVELVGEEEIRTVARLETRWAPAHGDVDATAFPADFELDAPWRAQPLAADTIAREIDGWLDRWELEVRGR